MPRADGITWAWITGRDKFPQPCDFCGEPIHKEHAYRVETIGVPPTYTLGLPKCGFCSGVFIADEPMCQHCGVRRERQCMRCERCLCRLDHEYNQHVSDCRMPSAGESSCRCLDTPHPLRIKWGVTFDTWTPEGERDAWEPIGGHLDTLQEAYDVAQRQNGQVNIVKWYITSTGSSGPTIWKALGGHFPPVEELQQRADGTYVAPPEVSGPCVVCAYDTLIKCRTCEAFLCWEHSWLGRLSRKHVCERSSSPVG